jgi:preprotein translocase YajC subunit
MSDAVACLLAQTPTGPGPGGNLMFIGLLVFMFVFFIVMSRTTRKGEEKKRKTLLNSLSKNDRVLTHSGIIGTIVAIRDHEIVLKVDESTNTKMTFIKTAVSQVITDTANLSPEPSTK